MTRSLLENVLVIEFPDAYRLVSEIDIDRTYSMQKTHISCRKPKRLLLEVKERRREMMKELNNDK